MAISNMALRNIMNDLTNKCLENAKVLAQLCQEYELDENQSKKNLNFEIAYQRARLEAYQDCIKLIQDKIISRGQRI